MTGTQTTIWDLLEIAPTQDPAIVADALSVQLEIHADDPVKIQQLQDAWQAYRANIPNNLSTFGESSNVKPDTPTDASSPETLSQESDQALDTSPNKTGLDETNAEQLQTQEQSAENQTPEHAAITPPDPMPEPESIAEPIAVEANPEQQIVLAAASPATNNSSSPSRNFAASIALGAFLIAILVGVSQIDSLFPELGEDNESVVQYEPYWAEDLNVCNQAKQVAEDDAFTQCLTLAEQGRVYAQMRVAWLFFESEDENHLQTSYDWMSKAGSFDETSRLLSKIMLFVHGTTEDDKLRGYKGIVKQADSGFAGAEAYLALLYLLEQNLQDKTANPVWLLEKAHRNDSAYVGVLDLVRIYLNGLATRVNEDKAVSIMKKYADSFFPTSANNAAWMIATSRDSQVFSPADAVKWAQSVVNDPSHSKNFGFIDTLAAAYAADGQFDLAIAEQKKAIALLKESQYSNETDLKEFNARLQAFTEGRKVTYFDMIVDAGQLFPAMKQELENLLLDELKFATEQP